MAKTGQLEGPFYPLTAPTTESGQSAPDFSTPETERPRQLHMGEEAHLEGDLILLSSPDLQARVVAAQLPEPLPVHSEQPSSHHGRPVEERA